MKHARRGSGFVQGDMYHIFAPQGYRQDSAALREYQPPGLCPERSRGAAAGPRTDPEGLVKSLATVLAGIKRVDQQVNVAGPCSGFDAFGAADETTRAG
ncbi:MAG: hypothetical protein M3448_07295, partial [Pseudomonadota bacterium]|nr:hypothetical protein [Pseudomonadota bacterium]